MGEQQMMIIATLSIVSGLLSMSAIVYIIRCYFKYKAIQVTEFKMIIYMLVGDFIITSDMVFISVWYFFVPDPSEPSASSNLQPTPVCSWACQLLAFLKVFGGMFSFIWTFNISYVLKETLYNTNYSIRKGWYRMQLMSFSAALIMAIIPFTGNAYGVVQPYLNNVNCFIIYGPPTQQEKYVVDDIMEIGCFYGPLWIICGYCIYVQIKIEQRLKHLYDNPAFKQEIKHLKLYPMVLLFCYVWISVYRVLVMADVECKPIETVIYLFQNLNGFINCIVYGYYTLRGKIGVNKRRNSNLSIDSDEDKNFERSNLEELRGFQINGESGLGSTYQERLSQFEYEFGYGTQLNEKFDVNSDY